MGEDNIEFKVRMIMDEDSIEIVVRITLSLR